MIAQPITDSITRRIVRSITGRSAGGKFHPLNLFGPSDQGIITSYDDLSLLFQDNLETTPVTAVGQSVGSIRSQVKGHKFIQATASSRGVLRQDGNGKYYLELDGTNDSYASSAAINFSGSDKMTHIWFGRWVSNPTAVGMITELTTDSGSLVGGFSIFTGAVTVTGFMSRCRGSLAGSIAGRIFTMNSANSVVISTHDIAGDLSTIDVNGIAGSGGTSDKGTGNLANAILYKFRRNNTNLPFGGNEYAEIIINRALTASEIAKVVAWGNAKMGVA